MAEHDKAVAAHPKVEAITAFYIHLSVFLVVIGILVAVNLVTTTNWWVQYPFLAGGSAYSDMLWLSSGGCLHS